MIDNNHIIKKIALNLELNEGLDVGNVRADVMSAVKTQMEQGLIEIMDGICHEEEVIRIDQLKINLGTIALKDISERVISEVKTELEFQKTKIDTYKKRYGINEVSELESTEEEHLWVDGIQVERKRGKKQESGFKTTPLGRKLDGFLDFLKTGTRSWWNPLKTQKEMDTFFNEITYPDSKSISSNISVELERLFQSNAKARQRLSFLFLKDEIEVWLNYWAPSIKKKLNTLNISNILEKTFELNKEEVTKLIVLSKIKHLTKSDRNTDSTIEKLLYALIETFIIELKTVKRNVFNQAVSTKNILQLKELKKVNSSGNTVDIKVLDCVITLLEKENKSTHIVDPITQGESPAFNAEKINETNAEKTTQTSLEKRDEKEQKQLDKTIAREKEKKKIKEKKEADAKANLKAIEEKNRQEADTKANLKAIEEKNRQEAAEILQALNSVKGERPKSEVKKHSEYVESAYFGMAGVVIIWPLIMPLFEDRGILDGRDFKDEEARFKGLHLLNYLVCGHEDLEESEMVLNKVLCEIPMDEPVFSKSNLTEGDKNEIENLLNHLITNWSVLKSTTSKGLREGFIVRDGELQELDENWLLKVEQKGIDILMGRIPWGYKTVKLPWMSKIVMVEW